MFRGKKDKIPNERFFLGDLEERSGAAAKKKAPAATPAEAKAAAPKPQAAAEKRAPGKPAPRRAMRDVRTDGEKAPAAQPRQEQATHAGQEKILQHAPAHQAPQHAPAHQATQHAPAQSTKTLPHAARKPEQAAPAAMKNEAVDANADHPFGATAFVQAFEKQAAKPSQPPRARRDMRRAEKKAVAGLSRSGRLREYIGDEKRPPEKKAENGVAAELRDMYAPEGGKKKGKKKLSTMDKVRYGVLFLCIAGFLTAGYFVFNKVFDYYKGSSMYKGLAEMVTQKDRFSDDYLARSLPQDSALTLEDIYNGRIAASSITTDADSDEQNLIAKVERLKQINSDTLGWIKIDNTIINYPVMWTKAKNYYLRRDFYKNYLNAGAIYMDERNSTNLAENRNTVIYGHNMSDGSMFASLHDFTNATVFYNSTIQLATTDGIFVYKAFSVHDSDAYDNYFETDFSSDRYFEQFISEMSSISKFESELEVNRSSQLLTLSTCGNNPLSDNDRFVVQAVLVDVIR